MLDETADDGVKPVPGAGEVRDAPVEVVTFGGQALEEFGGGSAVDDAGGQLGDGLAAQSGGIQCRIKWTWSTASSA